MPVVWCVGLLVCMTFVCWVIIGVHVVGVKGAFGYWRACFWDVGLYLVRECWVINVHCVGFWECWVNDVHVLGEFGYIWSGSVGLVDVHCVEYWECWVFDLHVLGICMFLGCWDIFGLRVLGFSHACC